MFPALLLSLRALGASQAPRLAQISAWPGRSFARTAPGGRCGYSPAPARHRGALGLRLRLEAQRLFGQVAAARLARAQGLPSPSPSLLRSSQRDSGTLELRLATCTLTPTGRPHRVAQWQKAGTPATARAWDTAHPAGACAPRTRAGILAPQNLKWGP